MNLRLAAASHTTSRRVAEALAVVVPGPQMVLALVLLAALLTRAGWLDRPPDGLIFDEAYYVNAARILIDRPVEEDAHYYGSESGIDPNREHPPLAKVLIAGSMKAFGDNAVGWRAPSIVAGMFSVLLIYGIVRAAGGDEWLGVLAASLLAFENLSLVHSRISTLDMPMVVFMLAAAWCYLKGWPLLAGIACAIAALMKIVGVYALAGLLLIEFFTLARGWFQTGRLSRRSFAVSLKMLASFAAVWISGLWLLDLWVTNFNTPWDHLRFILRYGFALTREGGPANQESEPWQWLINDVPMTYMRVDEQLFIGDEVEVTRPILNFRGAMTPVIVAAAPVGLAFALYRAWTQDDRLALWTAAWFIGGFVPFLPAWLIADRIMYIFYALPLIPAFVVGLALLFKRGNLPPIVLWGFLIAVAIGFLGYYPIRRF